MITPVPTTRLSLPVAATIGVLAVWAALGVGHLTAGLLSSVSHADPPFVSVTIRCRRRAPSRGREERLAQSDFASNGRDCLGVVLSDSSQEGDPGSLVS